MKKCKRLFNLPAMLLLAVLVVSGMSGAAWAADANVLLDDGVGGYVPSTGTLTVDDTAGTVTANGSLTATLPAL